MKNLKQRLQWLAPLMVFAIFWGVIWLRAQPAWFRGSYTTEGGMWLADVLKIGFWEAVKTIRPDYCVFGNLVVIQLSDWLNSLWHGSNLDLAPSIQHHAACAYVALMFVVIFVNLRRCHGAIPAFLVCLAMLVVPDLDGENRIFGEVTNLGYFSALVVLFIYYDLWINRDCSWGRLAIYLLIVLFHIATSPLAGVIAVAFTGVIALREGIVWWQSRKGLGVRLTFLAALAAPALFAIRTAVYAQAHNPYPVSAVERMAMKSRVVEVVIGRQLLYPLLFNVYSHLTDSITLVCLVLFLALVSWYVVIERRKSRNLVQITGVLLILGAAVGMALATAFSRTSHFLQDDPYASVWPARYAIAQNMVVAAFIAVVLVRMWQIPGLAFVLAGGVVYFVNRVPGSFAVKTAVGGLLCVAFAVITCSRNHLLRKHPADPNREAALMARSVLNPWHPGFAGQAAIAGFHMQLDPYVPEMVVIETLEELRNFEAACRKSSRECCVSPGILSQVLR